MDLKLLRELAELSWLYSSDARLLTIAASLPLTYDINFPFFLVGICYLLVEMPLLPCQVELAAKSNVDRLRFSGKKVCVAIIFGFFLLSRLSFLCLAEGLGREAA